MAETTEANSSPSELLAAGRRHLAVKDYFSAVDCLAYACEMLVQEHGEGADACGEVYLWYGKALLGLSRVESGVLGDKVARTGNSDEEEEEQDENGEVEENGEAESDQKDEESSVKLNGEQEIKENGTVEKIEAESTTNDDLPGASKSDAEEGPSTSTGEGNNAADESVANLEDDEVDNLQLAWEMLEFARGVLSRRAGSTSNVGGSTRSEGTQAARAQLADAYFALGEVALESETYDKAVEDLQSCLEIQKDIYPANDRRIAETHFQIGLASSLASKFEEAILHFKNAANILETRIKILENPTAATEDATVKKYSTSDPLYSVEAEIKELKELLPEIQEKIQDMMDYKAETMKSIREHLLPSNGSSNTNGAGSSSSSASKAPAMDISHRIKRKRKSDDGEGPSEAKKPNTCIQKS